MTKKGRTARSASTCVGLSLAIALASTPAVALAQWASPSTLSHAGLSPTPTLPVTGAGISTQLPLALHRPEGPQQAADGVSPARVTLLSALVPGAGQYVQGQRRAWVYVALEALGWVAYAERRSAGADLRSRYRDFAWTEARLRAGPRIDGDFDYYETLTHWQRSGSFDADGAMAGVQPEPDPATFNGSIWALATQLFLPGGPGVPEDDPQYQRALDYYRQRAYGPEFLWDWTGTGMAQDELASLIRRSDDRFRQATSILGLVFANHLVSMVDAYVSSRAPGASVRSAFVPSPGSGGLMWTTRVKLAAPW